jgi:adenylylsulfate kinase
VSWAIWITGLPGSGKSSLARAAAAELRARGTPVRVLELDEIRKALTPSPSYSDAEREVVYRALVYMATLLTQADVPVIIDATAHRRAWRELGRAEIPRFAEVQLACPGDLCRQRERTRAPGHAPRAIYARAGGPGATVPGVDVPYEPALAPELTIDTAREGVAEGAGKIVKLASSLAPGHLFTSAGASAGWAIWITGRPGSGKTTLAEGVAQAVAVHGDRVKVLDMAPLRHFLLREAAPSERQQEIAHRALAYAAKLLTEAGVAVIVDATAPRRAWRDAARELIPCFAEVQLRCPAEICFERERATRWRRAGVPPRTGALDVTPDIVCEYEESLRPELIFHTNIHESWSTVHQVLFLIHRLRRMTASRLEQPARRPVCESES